MTDRRAQPVAPLEQWAQSALGERHAHYCAPRHLATPNTRTIWREGSLGRAYLTHPTQLFDKRLLKYAV